MKTADIGTAEVTSADIANDGVGTIDILDDAITQNKILAGAVRTSEIANGQVQSADVLDEGLTGTDVGGLGGADINDNSLTGSDVDESSLNLASAAWHEIGAGGEPGFNETGNHCSWKNFDSFHNSAAFLRDREGFVHLKGLVDAEDGAAGCEFDFSEDRLISA